MTVQPQTTEKVGGREHRAYPRLDVESEALVKVGDIAPTVYQVRGICLGGTFLAFRDLEHTPLALAYGGVSRGDAVEIRFLVPTGGAGGGYVFRARVARMSDAGIGVAFIEPNTPAVQRLQAELLKRSQTGDGGATSTSGALSSTSQGAPGAVLPGHLRKRIVAEAGGLVTTFARSVVAEFLTETDAGLLTAADTSCNDQEQAVLLDAVAQLRAQRTNVERVFIEAIASMFGAGMSAHGEGTQTAVAPNTGLSLVDKDAFEEWLAIADAAAKTEVRHKQELSEIGRRLSVLSPDGGETKVNPVEPGAVFNQLVASLGDVSGDPAVRRVFYDGFAGIVSDQLGSLYHQLADLLNRTVKLEAPSDRKLAAARQGVPVTPLRQPTASDNVPQPQPQPQPQPHPPATPTLRPGGGGTPADPGAVFRNLLRVSRESAGCATTRYPGPVSTGPVAAGTVAEAAHGAVSREEFLHLLSDLQARECTDGAIRTVQAGLKERIFAALDNLHETSGSESIDSAQADSVEEVDVLVEAMLEDPHLDDAVKRWIRRLEVPMLKASMLDGEGFRADSHPVRGVLNSLGTLGMRAGSGRTQIPRQTLAAVDQIVERIASEFTQDTGVFAEALSELDTLRSVRSAQYQGNVDSVVSSGQRMDEVARARRSVTREIERRLKGRDVPQIVHRLLRDGWYAVLLLSHVQEGADTTVWRENLGVVDRLLVLTEQRTNKAPAPGSEVARLLGLVEQRLNLICYQGSEFVPVLQELRGLFGLRALDSAHDAEADTADHRAASAGGAGRRRVGRLVRFEPVPEGWTRQKWARWLKRTRAIEVGDWINLRAEGGASRFMRLVWVGQGRSVYVFVNTDGVKAAEFTMRELALALQAGTVEVLEDADIPLMERASRGMLQKMHNRLTYHATHDQLTGLVNRKEFERLLEEALRSAKADSRQHVLCHYDLDQFKVVNNNFGHTAGDTLLQQAARILEDKVGRESTLARLGGDEFGMLLEDCPPEEGHRIAEEQLRALNGFRFEWGEQRLYVSSSAGLVGITEHCDTVTSLLSAADSACFMAKDAGRNRIQVYQEDDCELARRSDEMQWVTTINSALDEDRLALRCQRIVPVLGDRETGSRYEILLSVFDEKGQSVSLFPFVQTAEQYNRMPDVDRWVVRNTLRWLSAHPEVLKTVAGFCINLSGNSLNDDKFVSFILGQLESTGVPATKICFEITETFAIANLDHAAEFIRDVKRAGCTFSLDDFGSGLSSYSYLKNLPVDYLKIDGMFVKDIVDSPHDLAVVKSINEIGHFMGKQTVAEYVASPAILEHIKDIGVDYAQGFGIEEPMLLADLARSQ